MPIRVRFKLDLALSSTSAEERDLGNIRKEVVTDALGEGGARKTLLLAGATDVQISLDAVADAKLLVITTVPKDPNEDPTEILLRFNSITGEQRSVAPLADCKEGFLVLTTTGLTSLFASNPGATDTELTVGLAGD